MNNLARIAIALIGGALSRWQEHCLLITNHHSLNRYVTPF